MNLNILIFVPLSITLPDTLIRNLVTSGGMTYRSYVNGLTRVEYR